MINFQQENLRLYGQETLLENDTKIRKRSQITTSRNNSAHGHLNSMMKKSVKKKQILIKRENNSTIKRNSSIAFSNSQLESY